jgi:steroid delta-isomerase-like uncharacterized protein
MTEFERDLGRRWFELVWNQGRREAIAELFAPDGVLHDGGTDTVGPDGFYPFFDRMNAAFSGIRVNVEDSLADGDRVCVRWSCTAEHSGSGLGFPATGKPIHVTGISILRSCDNRIIEAWQNWDMLGMMEQIRGTTNAATARERPLPLLPPSEP